MTIKFTDDLPNGPYAEISNYTNCTVFTRKGATVQDASDLCMKAWIESRSGVQGKMAGWYSYQEGWFWASCKKQGGDVPPSTVAQEATYQMGLGVDQKMKMKTSGQDLAMIMCCNLL